MSRILAILGLFCASLAFGQDHFFATDQMPEIRLRVEADNWRYLLDSLRYNGTEYLEVDLTVDGTVLPQVGVRYLVDRSFTPGSARNGLVIDLQAFGKDQQYAGHRRIQLSSALRDPSLMREVIAYEIAGKYFPSPRANFAKVYVNEEYYGLFVNVEAVEEAFLEAAYGDSSGALYYANPAIGSTPAVAGCGSKIYGSLQYEANAACLEHNWDQLQGDSWAPIHQLTKALDQGDIKALENLLDIDATLWMLAFNNVTVNLNSYLGQYANAYYLYQDTDGRFHPILADLNLAFGSFKNDGVSGSDLKTTDLLMLSPNLHLGNDARPLIKVLLGNEFYYKQYLSYYRTILVEQFLSGRFENQIRNLRAQIANAVAMDQNKYYTAAEYEAALSETTGKRSRIPGILSFMDKRAEWLQKQPVYTLLPPEISRVGVRGRERFSRSLLNEFRIYATVTGYPRQVYVYYRFGNDGLFQRQAMANDGEHYDGKANDDIYGVVITPPAGSSSIQYYLMAENAKTMHFSPTNYYFEQYQTTLSEVNQ
ncbi:MAG: hypothetical protein D6772_16425 [Bacteroidetes bacterium]|nr:MAG: hypothetical protein D6772_16425 [Bacteroidota bacterium]